MENTTAVEKLKLHLMKYSKVLIQPTCVFFKEVIP